MNTWHCEITETTQDCTMSTTSTIQVTGVGDLNFAMGILLTQMFLVSFFVWYHYIKK